MKKLNEALIGLVAAVVFCAASLTMKAYAASVLWGWFVVPLFALPALSLVNALGLGLVVGIFQNVKPSDGPKDQSNITASMIKHTLFVAFFCLMILLVGYVVKQFA